MEIFNLPLRIVVALWIIRRMNVSGYVVPLSKYYQTRIAYLNEVLRIEDPLHKESWLEWQMRKIANSYRRNLDREAAQMLDIHVSSLGFIKRVERRNK